MKIFTAEKIRQADEFTIKNEPISSFFLMERAATSCANWIFKNCKNHTKFAVFCGSGNNGGDGLAIARMLYLKGFDVEVFVDINRLEFSSDAQQNFNLVKEISGISVRDFKEAINDEFCNQTIIIDAIFGTGLTRKLEGFYVDLITFLNSTKNPKIAIDVPSGLFLDEFLQENQVVFKANYTLSFQFWKRSFLHPETGVFTGKVIILDIQLDSNFIENTQSDYFVIDEEVILEIFKPRNQYSHKGNYGKVVIVGGSYGKIGAAVLATQSALKTGSGLTFTIAPNFANTILQIACPEAMFVSGGENFVNFIEFDNEKTYGIGPGLGTEKETGKAIIEFLKKTSKPLVLDADALNLIAKSEENLNYIPKKSIITPHPKEFERLFGKTNNSFERLDLAKKKATQYDIFIVLKDHHTQVVTPKGLVFYNITGNSGLAKGGSGDILTGIITSLLAQNYSPKDACLLGVWLHGKAADFAAEKFSEEAMLPTDVINELGNVFLKINKKVTTLL